jgi:serine/threonine-protein kinase TTK/MPS1
VAAELQSIASNGHKLSDWISLLDDQRAQSDGPDSLLADLYSQATDALSLDERKSPDFAHVWLGHAQLQMALGMASETIRDTFKYMKSERIGQSYKGFYVARAKFELSAGNKDKATEIERQGDRCQGASHAAVSQQRATEFAAFLARPLVQQDKESTGRVPVLAATLPTAATPCAAAAPVTSLRRVAAAAVPTTPTIAKLPAAATATPITSSSSLSQTTTSAPASTPAPTAETSSGKMFVATRVTGTPVVKSAAAARKERIAQRKTSSLQALRVSRTAASFVEEDEEIRGQCSLCNDNVYDTQARRKDPDTGLYQHDACMNSSSSSSSSNRKPPARVAPAPVQAPAATSGRVSPDALTEVYTGGLTASEIKAKKKVAAVLGPENDATVAVATAITSNSAEKRSRGRPSLEDVTTTGGAVVNEDTDIAFNFKKPRRASVQQQQQPPQLQHDATATLPIAFGNTSSNAFRTPMTSRIRSTAGRQSSARRPPSGKSSLSLETPTSAYATPVTSRATNQSYTTIHEQPPHQTPTVILKAMRTGGNAAPNAPHFSAPSTPIAGLTPVGGAATTSTTPRSNGKQFKFDQKTEVVVINGKSYQKLNKIGSGGSANVFKVIGRDCKILALKEVDLSSADQETIDSYENEIKLLQNLQGNPYIIKLKGWNINRAGGFIHILLEVGDADLNTVLKNRRKAKKGLDANYLRLYWQQMLEAVHCVHQANVVHSDLKPANFLFVEGNLKLIDFGIAKAIQDDQTSAIRDSAVGTLNYMAPEAIATKSMMPGAGKKMVQCVKIGPPADVWSLGCILYSMTYGKTPFQHLNPLQKLQAITNADYEIEFPGDNHPRGLVETMKACLLRGDKERLTIPDLLRHKFLNPTSVATPAKTPSKNAGLTQEQLYAILRQLGSQSGTGVTESPGMLSRRIFSQLADGGDMAAFKLNSGNPSPANMAPPKMGSMLKSGLASGLGGLKAANNVLSQGAGRGACAGAGKAAPLQRLDMNALAMRKTALKKVEAAQPLAARSDGSMEGLLREQLGSKFHHANQADATAELTATEWR